MTQYGPRPADYPKLPGPARFIADVAETLRTGDTVIVMFPDVAVESGLADAVLDAIADESAGATYCELNANEQFPARVLATFGADLVRERAFDDWESIIRWQPWQGQWLILPAWEHQDIGEILNRWPAQVHAAGLSADARPALVIGARLSDIARTTLDHLDQGHLSIRWWWGVLDHLDTQTRIATVAGRRLNPIDSAVITEVAVWDLECVDYLAANWDRTTSGLPTAVLDYQTDAPVESCYNLAATDRKPTAAPPAVREQAWRDGLVDQWGHTTNRSPRILDSTAIQQRIWLAHNRTLIVHVDEERAHYEEIILGSASRRAMDHLDRRGDDIIEIGSLAYLVTAGWVDLNRRERARLCDFRDLRNALAHRTPVNDGLRTRIIAYLGFR